MDKNKFIKVRVTPEECEAITGRALDLGLSVSELIRQAAMGPVAGRQHCLEFTRKNIKKNILDVNKALKESCNSRDSETNRLAMIAMTGALSLLEHGFHNEQLHGGAQNVADILAQNINAATARQGWRFVPWRFVPALVGASVPTENQNVLDMLIVDLVPNSILAINCLRAEGVETVRQLIGEFPTVMELRRIPSLNKNSYLKIEHGLRAIGFAVVDGKFVHERGGVSSKETPGEARQAQSQ